MRLCGDKATTGVLKMSNEEGDTIFSSDPDMTHQHKPSSASNTVDDFVSRDVNQALQEARDILTKGKARKNSGERLIEDSTAIKFNQGCVDGPVEVMISRSRIVASQPNSSDDEEELLGSFSDSDLPKSSRHHSFVSRKCSHMRSLSDDELLTNADDAGNASRVNVRYRRKHDELWRRDDQYTGVSSDDMEDDEAQLEVRMNEECCGDEGTHLLRKTWEARWTVQHYDLLPDWLQDNDFLHTGHRPPLPSFAECFKSILSLHTETGNIWTHMIGCVAFLCLGLWWHLRPDNHIQLQDQLVFSFFFVGAILCLGLSFVFHTVSCHSKEIVRVFSKLDYVGISLLIVGSFIPWIYYGFYCRKEPKISYIAMVSVLGIGAVVVSLWDKFSETRYRPFRAGVFVAMGCSGIVPTIHFIVTDGMRRLIDENSFYWLLAMAFLYLIGAFLYATRTPERFFPGKCDIWLHSHQIFHLCVVCAAFAHYYGISEMAFRRLTTNTCDIDPVGPNPLHAEL
ncbi:hemolysin-III related domain-containing protein [Ditylenchus destructor]|nr:hemolysin-III related domain-containing protein [Ditylenchus destructor]